MIVNHDCIKICDKEFSFDEAEELLDQLKDDINFIENWKNQFLFEGNNVLVRHFQFPSKLFNFSLWEKIINRNKMVWGVDIEDEVFGLYLHEAEDWVKSKEFDFALILDFNGRPFGLTKDYIEFTCLNESEIIQVRNALLKDFVYPKLLKVNEKLNIWDQSKIEHVKRFIED